VAFQHDMAKYITSGNIPPGKKYIFEMLKYFFTFIICTLFCVRAKAISKAQRKPAEVLQQRTHVDENGIPKMR
jgi:hypothetical protein